MDFVFELYVVDQGYGFWLVVNCVGYFCFLFGYLVMVGVFFVEQIKGYGIWVIDVKGICVLQFVFMGDVSGDDVLFIQLVINGGKCIYFFFLLCYGVYILLQ